MVAGKENSDDHQVLAWRFVKRVKSWIRSKGLEPGPREERAGAQNLAEDRHQLGIGKQVFS